jgi:gas vesicle protein
MTDYEHYGDYRPLEGGGNFGPGLTMLLVGLGAGALIGLLLAPKTGKHMRRTLRRRYEDARDAFEDLSDQAGDVLGRGADYANAVRERVEPIGRVINKRRW